MSSFPNSFVNAFKQGLEIRYAQEERERRQEEDKLRLTDLKNQMARIKQKQAEEDFKTRYGIWQGQPGPSVPGVEGTTGGMEDLLNAQKGAPQVMRSPIAGLPEQNFPHLPVPIPEHLGSGTITPQTQQEVEAQSMKDLINKKKIEQLFAPLGQLLEPIGTSGSVNVRTGEVIPPAEKPVQPAAATQPLSDERFAQELRLRSLGGGDQRIAGRDYPLPPEVEAQRQRMAAANRAASATAMPATVKKDLSKLDKLEQALVGIQSKVEQNPDWVGGILSGGQNLRARLREKRGVIDQNEALFRKEVMQGLVKQIHELSGAAVSPSEAERLLGALPNLDMSAPEFKAAVLAAITDIRRTREALTTQFQSTPTAPQEYDFDPTTGELVPR